MVTEQDLYNGLFFKSGRYEYRIYNLEKGTIQSIDSKTIYGGYTKKHMCSYFNGGSWILLSTLTKTYELW
jgi:hypothetical protein